MTPKGFKNFIDTPGGDRFAGVPHVEHQIGFVGPCGNLDGAVWQAMG